MEAPWRQLRSSFERVGFPAFGALGIGLAIFALFPSARPWILEEYRLIENLSALTFFLAGAWASLHLLRRRGRETTVLCIVAFLGFLGCADELSFGERLFELEMPTIRGLKIDGAHDFAEVFAKGGRDLFRAHPMVVASLLGGMLLAVLMALRRYRAELLRFAESTLVSPSRLALAMAVAWVGIATVIDLPLKFLESDWIRAAEELFELSAGVLLCGAAYFSQAEPAQLNGEEPDTASSGQ